MIGALRSLRSAFRLPSGIIGGVLMGVVAIAAIAGRAIAPLDPNAVDLAVRLKGPSLAHWMGTDELGRDLWSRVLDGAGRTASAAVIVVAASVIIGTIIGALAGYYGGWLDAVLMRLTDIFIGYPALLLAIAIAAALGIGMPQTVVALVAVWWAGYARLVRGQAAALRTLEYIEAARVTGASRLAVLWAHILPNTLAPVIVKATIDLALVVESVAALGFIGLGAQPPVAEWGSMIAASQTYALQAWWYPVAPGIALLVIVLGSNLLGDSFAYALGSIGRASWFSVRRWKRDSPGRSVRKRSAF